jgi:predicted AAA+ superfamily ATPase
VFHRLAKPSKTNSFFLFGARGTGKSTLLKSIFSPENCLWIDLLEPELEAQLLVLPSRLRELWKTSKKPWIVIDEVQKIPKLLEVVHAMIESEKVLFALTGSSARKLRHGQANLLAGRSFSFHLYPLTVAEIGDVFSLENALSFGTMPKIFSFADERDKELFLKSYANIYLKEEIQAEQLVRNMEPFRKFLPVAAASHSKPLNYARIARDSGVDPKSVERYFSILEDTLVGFFLDSFHRSVRARQKSAPKFYFFDTGVQRALSEMLDVKPSPRSSYYGELFEAFVVAEIYRRISYSEKQIRMSYLQTPDGLEIDLLIEHRGKVAFAIEIKSKKEVTKDDLSSLRKIEKDFPITRRMVLCQEERARITEDEIEIWPWLQGIEQILNSKPGLGV